MVLSIFDFTRSQNDAIFRSQAQKDPLSLHAERKGAPKINLSATCPKRKPAKF